MMAFMSAVLAAAVVSAPIEPPHKSPLWGAPETVYLDLPHHGGFAISNGWDRAFSTSKLLRRRTGRHRADALGGAISPCGVKRLLCFEGLITLAVDPAALDEDRPYEVADVDFMPQCLYRLASHRCGLAVIKYAGKASLATEGSSGFFVYETGFGVRLFAGADSKTGEISSVFSYASGRPLLSK